MWAYTAAYALLLLALVERAPVQTAGDGPEYIVYGVAFARGLGPGLLPETITEIGRELASFDANLAVQPTDDWTFERRDGRREFIHFWLYPWLAAPFVAAARTLSLDPRHGFTVFNLALLLTAFVSIRSRLGAASAFLLCAGPIVWWANKAHPEVLLFSLTSVALTTWRERPWLALGAAGVAAAQVPPFAALVPLLAIAAIVDKPQRSRQPGFLLAAAVGLVLAAWPVVHYLRNYGRPTLLAGGGWESWHWPIQAELAAPLFDLNVGFALHHPFFAVAVVTAGVLVAATGWRRLIRPDVVVAACLGTILLLAFPQIHNWTHGGTPGISRFAVWLTPLAIPLLAAAADAVSWRRLVPWMAVASVLWTVTYFEPKVAEARPHERQPTWIARQVWLHAPSWSDPLPVIFASVLKPARTTLPIAAEGCRKVLLIGRGEAQGMWPRPCPPAPVPTECRSPGALCWANRTRHEYRFERISGPALPFPYDPEPVWQLAAETGLNGAMSRVDWWTLRSIDQPIAFRQTIRQVVGANIESALEANNRLFVVLTEVRSDAAIVIAAPPGASGVLIDGLTGRTLRSITNDAGSTGVWRIPLPTGPIIVVALFP